MSDAGTTLREALERTVEQRTASLRFSRNDAYGELPRRRAGGIVGRLLDVAETTPIQADGFIDFAAGRASMVYRRRTVVVERDRMWVGQPGDPVVSDHSRPADDLQALWTFDLCRGINWSAVTVTDATPARCLFSAPTFKVAAEADAGYCVRRLDAAPTQTLHATVSDGLVESVRLRTLLVTDIELRLADFGCVVPAEHWRRFPKRAGLPRHRS